MGRQRSGTVDIAMLGSFGVWTRGTLQSRALPFARALTRMTGLRFAIVTTPWDDPEQSGMTEVVDDVLVYNTRSTAQTLFPAAVAEQFKLVRQLNPALVHVMKPKAYAGLAGQLLTRTGGKPKLLVDYDDWEGDGGWNDRAGYPVAARRLFAFQERQLIRSADGVSAASTLLAERASRLRVSRRHPSVTYLPNGLEASWLASLSDAGDQPQGPDKPELVLYSRFAEFSMAWLGDMLRMLDRKLDQPVTLHIVGRDEPDAPGLRGLKWLELDWHGFVQRDEIPAILSRTSIALYPYDDNLINRSKQSVKLLELMAAGCAVVASDVGDIRRTGGDAVLAVPPGDAEAFTSAVHGLIAEPARAVEFGRRARIRAGEFTIERLAERLHDVYRACGVR